MYYVLLLSLLATSEQIHPYPFIILCVRGEKTGEKTVVNNDAVGSYMHTYIAMCSLSGTKGRKDSKSRDVTTE